MTPRQREVYLWIGRYVAEHHRPPTFREIGQALGISSPNGVTGHVDALERGGWILREGDTARGLRLPAVSVAFDERWEPTCRDET